MLSLKTEIGAEIRGVDGKLRVKIPFQRCHSLLKQFIQLLYCQCAQSAISIKDTSGVMHSVGADSMNLRANATNQTAFGVVIGSGDTNPVAMDDYKLEAQLTSNIGHNNVSVATESAGASIWRLVIARGFNNNTGGTVNVKEVGLYVFNSTIYQVCVDRTLYDVSFVAGETLTLTYRLTITL